MIRECEAAIPTVVEIGKSMFSTSWLNAEC
jgi:hypothetical protein